MGYIMNDGAHNFLNLKPKFAGASLLAMFAAACASDDRYYDYGLNDTQPYYDATYNPRDRYSLDYKRDQRGYEGINGARVAHRLYADARAESLDGDCERRVRLERGETLSDIAEYCDVPVAALIDYNPQLPNPRYISEGTLINVPPIKGKVYEGAQRYFYNDREYGDNYLAGGSIDSDRRGRAFYTIRRGDTLGEISQKFQVPLRVLINMNPRIEPRRLEVGDKILLPDYARTLPNERRHNDYRYDPDAPPVVSISPARGPRQGRVRVIGENFHQGEEVTIFFGATEDDLTKLKLVETDGDGRIDEVVQLPQDYNHSEAYIALRDPHYDDYFMSEVYVVDMDKPRRGDNSRPTHVVQAGQSLAWIAGRYNVRMSEIRRLNPSVDFTRLQRGQRLLLPFDATRTSNRGDANWDAAPTLSAVQHSVYRGDDITLAADGFPPSTPIAIYGGEDANSLTKLVDVRSGPRGGFTIDVRMPESINSSTAVFAAAIGDGAQTIYSERVEIVDGGDRYSRRDVNQDKIAQTPRQLERGVESNPRRRGGFLARFRGNNSDYVTPSPVGGVDSAGIAAIAGVLTDEGTKCPSLRDDAGNLYTLLGDLEGFDDGDRVLVRGTVQADDRICAQAETVQVFEIESAPW